MLVAPAREVVVGEDYVVREFRAALRSALGKISDIGQPEHMFVVCWCYFSKNAGIIRRQCILLSYIVST